MRALPHVVLTVVLTAAFLGLEQAFTTAAGPIGWLLPHPYAAPPAPACGSQLGYAGYSVTLKTGSTAQGFEAAASLPATDVVPEFQPISSAAPSLQADTSAQSLDLAQMQVVNTSAFAGQSSNAIVSHLRALPNVAAAEPIWLQSADKRYLSCDYKLRDNAAAQAVAARVRTALIARGISASVLDDAGTTQFVSQRHVNGRTLLQVAFVRRPVNAPSAIYVALLDPSTQTVLAVARANWYNWE